MFLLFSVATSEKQVLNGNQNNKYLILINCDRKLAVFAHSSREWRDNLKELKTICRFVGSVYFSS